MGTIPLDQNHHPEQSNSPSVVETGWLGDWLLTFQSNRPFQPARRPDGTWEVKQIRNGWRLWQSPVGEDWHGTPYTRIESLDWAAYLIGELYGAADPIDAVSAVMNQQATPASMNGHFVLLAYIKSSAVWHIWTNRYATLHAYIAQNGHRIAVGSFLPAVATAAECAELDWAGLASFFRFGFFIADRTHYADVRILRPARHYAFNPDGRLISQERYWQWWHSPDVKRSYDETVEEFAGIFGEVMRDLTTQGQIAFPISGGLDSRSTIAAIDPADDLPERMWAFSYGYSDDSIETNIAGRIAAKRNLNFSRYTIQPYLFDRLDLIINAVEGFQDVTQSRQAAITEQIARHADYLIAAHFGDVYLDDMGVPAALPGTLTDEDYLSIALKKIKKGGSDWLVENLCRNQVSDNGIDALLNRLVAEELHRFPEVEEPDYRIKAFKVDQWSARWTSASIRMFQAAAFPRLPFYDTRLTDFFATVPATYVAGRRLQIDYLKRYAPDLAGITWQVTGVDLYKGDQNSAWALPRRVVNKGKRLVTGHQVIERNWEVQFLGESGRRGLQQWLLRPGLRLHEFVPQSRVADLVESFYSDPLTDKRGYTVSMLLTFSAWLEILGPGRNNL